MTGVASKFVKTSVTKGYLAAASAIGKLHQVASGAANKVAGSFRKVGKSPEDKSGFPVQHAGDNK